MKLIYLAISAFSFSDFSSDDLASVSGFWKNVKMNNETEWNANILRFCIKNVIIHKINCGEKFIEAMKYTSKSSINLKV